MSKSFILGLSLLFSLRASAFDTYLNDCREWFGFSFIYGTFLDGAQSTIDAHSSLGTIVDTANGSQFLEVDAERISEENAHIYHQYIVLHRSPLHLLTSGQFKHEYCPSEIGEVEHAMGN